MDTNDEFLGNLLNQMLPNIINDSAVGPFISMSRMLDIVVKRAAFRGCMYDNSSLFPDELIARFRESGQAVDNAHRITLILGNRSGLALHILAEAPGTEAFVRYKLVYTDGSITAESAISYGSQPLTAEHFEDLKASFEHHRPLLTTRLDEQALLLTRKRLERQVFKQALPIFAADTVPQHGYPYNFVFESRDLHDGAFLDIRLSNTRMIRFRLTMSCFESQLASIGECIAVVDSNTEILTARELERHQLEILELRKQLPKSARDKVTLAHFVHRAQEILVETLGSGCFKTCYLNGLTAELYLPLPDNLWLKSEFKSHTFEDDIDNALARRTQFLRVMDRAKLTFSVGNITYVTYWIPPSQGIKES